MKKVLLIVFLSTFSIFAANAQTLQAFMSYNYFDSPADGPYIETYLSVYGPSIIYVAKDNGTFQGAVEVTIIFRQGEKIVNYDKYEVLSEELSDTSGVINNFLSQQRYLLKNGSYDMEFIIGDLNGDNEPYISTNNIVINFPEKEACISGIELLSGYSKTDTPGLLTKSGVDLYPYIFTFYPESIDKINFYCEVYNTIPQFGENGKLVYTYYIQSYETKSQLKDYGSMKASGTAEVIPILREIDIRELPSGNYYLVVEIRDENNEVVTQNQIFFQRSNPNIQFNTDDLAAVKTDGTFVDKMNNEDTLRMYIKFLAPIGSELDRIYVKNQLDDANIRTMKQYLLNFWKLRDELNPELAWNQYLQQVEKVNSIYSTPNRLGYDTDRGRVFLKYGPPNIISESYNEPAAYPYEIWQYYTLGTNQRNKKFVFYTIDLVTNDFQMVHSDAIGEVYNSRWQVEIYKRTYDPYSLDEDYAPDAWGSNVNMYWENPR